MNRLTELIRKKSLKKVILNEVKNLTSFIIYHLSFTIKCSMFNVQCNRFFATLRMTAYQIILLVFLAINIPITTLAGEPEEKFSQAGEAYKKGDYEQSAAIFEQIAATGNVSAELYYNLGNAYYKAGKIPFAILNYERAKRLAPGDDDIDFNLKIANLRIVDKIEPLPKLFYVELLESVGRSMTSTSWSVTAIIVVWIAVVAAAGFVLLWQRFLRKLSLAVIFISLIMAVASIVFAYDSSVREQSSSEAIVFSPNAYVKSSPDEVGMDLFILHEGAKVELLDQLDVWKKIRIANGSIGWIKANDIEII